MTDPGHHVLRPGAWMGSAVRCIDPALLLAAEHEADQPVPLNRLFEGGTTKHRSRRPIDPWHESDSGGKRGPWPLREGDLPPKELAA